MTAAEFCISCRRSLQNSDNRNGQGFDNHRDFLWGFKSSEEMKRIFLILCSVVAVIRVNEEKCFLSNQQTVARYPNNRNDNKPMLTEGAEKTKKGWQYEGVGELSPKQPD